ncbi:GNAT family N-acetyltransferase [Paludisphaera rhizosphaerae]|uniref:GNAT family N-acetyltransferase n=1 Tax=Paludisphaera rhizosphaerae TaxID=2711216 RepID=UPI0013EB0A18|nr:GNAT family N-acetyltransferase [Paludisphaera rhizosphaerae]
MQATARGLTAESLAWDTAHFGLSIARIQIGCDDSGLGQALTSARRDGLELVYVFTPPEFSMPNDLLARFDGLKVDERVVFSIDLEVPHSDVASSDSLHLSEAPCREPSPALIELAVAAGEYSRFAVDPRIPEDRFRRLYEVWIARSCLREAADVVFVAEEPVTNPEPLGLITASVRDGTGVIGLVAVSPTARRRGVGRAMMSRVQEWLAARGVKRSSVVTQEANGPACSLYRSCGYSPIQRETIYHFRPCGSLA